jgi:hypothetical protein
MLSDILKSSLKALTSPREAFKNISDGPINYLSISTFLLVGGILWIHLHSYLLFTEPIWQRWSIQFLYSTMYALVSLHNWLGVSLGIWYMQKTIFRKDATLTKIERAVFPFALIWLVLPILDLPHLFFDKWLIALPLLGIHPIHLSSLLAFFVISFLLFFFFREIFGFRNIILLALFGIGAFIISKFILQDIAFLIEEFAYSAGLITGKYNDAVFGMAIAAPVFGSYYFFRILLVQNKIWKALLIGILITMGLYVWILPAIYSEKPEYPDYASDSGIVDARNSSEVLIKDFVYEDVLHLDLEAGILKSLKCIVQLVNETISSEDSFVRCDIAPGPAVGQNLYELIGNRLNGPNGSTEYATEWNDEIILNKITDNNDIRVHFEVAPGDVISFSGIWVEIIQP